MPIYEFRCASEHEHERSVPISERDQQATCPRCGAPTHRRISAPRLGRLGSSAGRMIERSEASAHQPAVVDRVPGNGRSAGTRITTDPRHARLPRP